MIDRRKGCSVNFFFFCSGTSHLPDTPTTVLLPPTPFLKIASLAQPLTFPVLLTPLLKLPLLIPTTASNNILTNGWSVEVSILDWDNSDKKGKWIDLKGTKNGEISGVVIMEDEEWFGIEYSALKIRDEIVRRNKVGNEV